MAKKKYKPMTKREKEEMKQIRKELREKGAIPPVKKRLNRKDYIENTKNKWNEPEEGELLDLSYQGSLLGDGTG